MCVKVAFTDLHIYQELLEILFQLSSKTHLMSFKMKLNLTIKKQFLKSSIWTQIPKTYYIG